MTVSIVKTERAADVRKAVELLGGMERFVSSGDTVVVKPNICVGKESSTGVVTDPEMVAEVCRMVSECGARPVVAESPIFPLKAGKVFRKAGYGDFELTYGFPLVDIDSAENLEIKINEGKAIDHSVVPKLILTCDRLIDMPVMKTHLQTVVTLGLKNLKGVVVGEQKHIIHLSGLDQGIVDLNKVVRSDLIIIDGIVGMDGIGGPTQGNTVEIGVIVAGDNVVEVDSVGIRIMGGDPRKVAHVRLAAEQGLGSLDGFETLGDSIESASRKLALPRLPSLNRLLITGIGSRLWMFARNLKVRVTGGEKVRRSARLGELVIDHDTCDGCRLCIPACPVDALTFADELICDRDVCVRCFCCAEICPTGALGKRI